MPLSQRLQEKLLQKLSPQQIQLMKLLQVPTASLEVRIKEELEENPALELDEDKHEENPEELKDEFAENGVEDYEENTDSVDVFENIDISEYVHEGDDDIADYKLMTNNYPDEEERRESPVKTETSFYDTLRSQLGLLKLDEKQMRIAEQIIGSIDENGYLRRETSAMVDDLAFRQNITATEEEVETLIRQIQLFEPAGVGARDLQACSL